MLCTEYIDKYGFKGDQLVHAIQVILEYERFHQNQGYNLNVSAACAIEKAKLKVNGLLPCKQEQITRNDF